MKIQGAPPSEKLDARAKRRGMAANGPDYRRLSAVVCARSAACAAPEPRTFQIVDGLAVLDVDAGANGQRKVLQAFQRPVDQRAVVEAVALGAPTASKGMLALPVARPGSGQLQSGESWMARRKVVLRPITRQNHRRPAPQKAGWKSGALDARHH